MHLFAPDPYAQKCELTLSGKGTAIIMMSNYAGTAAGGIKFNPAWKVDIESGAQMIMDKNVAEPLVYNNPTQRLSDCRCSPVYFVVFR